AVSPPANATRCGSTGSRAPGPVPRPLAPAHTTAPPALPPRGTAHHQHPPGMPTPPEPVFTIPGIAVHDPGMGVHDARNGRSGWIGISVQDGPAHAPIQPSSTLAQEA